jgi:hypothetical protein
MKKHLNWTFDYNRNQETGVDFSMKIYEILNECKVSGYEKRAQYLILPNFRYNHQNPNILTNHDLVIGELIICRDKEENNWNYRINGFDSTSGNEFHMEFLTADEESRSLDKDWLMTMVKPVNCSIAGKIDKSKIYVTQKSSAGDSVELSEQNYSGKVINYFTLIDLFTNDWILKHKFNLIDDSNNVIKNAGVQFLEEDEILINGSKVTIRGYCVSGRGFPPAYYWVDPEGRVIIITTRLLTYVLK